MTLTGRGLRELFKVNPKGTRPERKMRNSNWAFTAAANSSVRDEAEMMGELKSVHVSFAIATNRQLPLSAGGSKQKGTEQRDR